MHRSQPAQPPEWPSAAPNGSQLPVPLGTTASQPASSAAPAGRRQGPEWYRRADRGFHSDSEPGGSVWCPSKARQRAQHERRRRCPEQQQRRQRDEDPLGPGGGVGAFAGGLLLFVAGIAVGGEGEYLMERERMSRIVEHDHELESGMEALKMKYDHDLSESTAGLRDELDKEKAKEKELEEELEAEHQVRKRYLLSVLMHKNDHFARTGSGQKRT